ncbi:flagellar hook-basal body protein [Lachnospiraceae bacterium OttesenSCG-928-D06]|nr:flagellar hook-basal body protein [Lachnospiraceae bacterium OttesenSCG-928-D06]
MLKGLYTAYTGMINEQKRMDTMTNNLANSTTVGFKKEGTTSEAFRDILAYKIKDNSIGLSNIQGVGVNNPGVKLGENYTDYTQGSFQITENTYDLALGGEGFFAIEFTNKAGETSTKYTRAGAFTLDVEGYLRTKDGDYVLDTQNKHIKIDPNQPAVIGGTGIVSQGGKNIAQIQVVDFEDYNYLEKYGETYFQPIEGAKLTGSNASINSGYLEASNVQIVSEMVDLIAITRQYEANQKLIQTYDESLGIAVTQVGKV